MTALLSDDSDEDDGPEDPDKRDSNAKGSDDDNDDNDDTPLGQFRYRKRGQASPSMSQHSMYSQLQRHADKTKEASPSKDVSCHKAASSTGLDVLEFSHSGGPQPPQATMAMPSLGSQSQDRTPRKHGSTPTAPPHANGDSNADNTTDPLAAFNFQQARRRPRAKRTEHGEIARGSPNTTDGSNQLPLAKSAKGESLLASKELHRSDVDLLSELGVPKQVAQAGPARKKKSFS
jgi:hypothetical protein